MKRCRKYLTSKERAPDCDDVSFDEVFLIKYNIARRKDQMKKEFTQSPIGEQREGDKEGVEGKKRREGVQRVIL